MTVLWTCLWSDFMETPLQALKTAIENAGGQSALARKVGCSQPTIWYWLNRLGQVPAERVVAVEAAGHVPRFKLRPDLYAAPTKLPEEQGGLMTNNRAKS